MRKNILFSGIITVCLLLLFSNAQGMPILAGTTGDGGATWILDHTDDDGVRRQAEASFSFVDGDLIIILTNTASTSLTPNQMLAGLLFDYSGSFNDYIPHVTAAPGEVNTVVSLSDLYYDGTRVNLDGEYGYLTGIGDNNFTGADYVVSATSLDPEPDPSPDAWPSVSDPIDPVKNYLNPPSTNGADWAIAGGSTNGANGVPDNYIQSSIQIVWQIDEGIAGDISNVHFIYGTSYSVPEPATMLLLGIGLIGLAGFSRKRFKRAA